MCLLGRLYLIKIRLTAITCEAELNCSSFKMRRPSCSVKIYLLIKQPVC